MARVSKCSSFKRTSEVVKHRQTGDPSSGRKFPGRAEYEAIMLDCGMTNDPEFCKWAWKVWSTPSSTGSSVA